MSALTHQATNRALAAASARMNAPDDDYTDFCRKLRDMCGVDLSQYKRGQMERRLRTYYDRLGIKDLRQAIPALKADRTELEALLDRVTINVSQLWRNPEMWATLTDGVLPQLVSNRPLLIWSAGSSYGAEAFTLAAICRDKLPAARTRILGTDIDPRMVARAKAGVFDTADMRTAPRDAVSRHFDKTPDNRWEAKRELKAMVRFETGDLLRINPKAETYDLVLCRNTVIYFDDDVRDELHARLARSLRPGGVLVIGSTERVSSPRELGLQTIFPFIFKKLAVGEQPCPRTAPLRAPVAQASKRPPLTAERA